MNIRKLHRKVGMIFSPFFLLTAVTGILLLWRKAGVYGPETKKLLLGFHNWEIGAKYIGVILALGLLLMTITGLALLIQSRKKN